MKTKTVKDKTLIDELESIKIIRGCTSTDKPNMKQSNRAEMLVHVLR
jgi:hypothetical protein